MPVLPYHMQEYSSSDVDGRRHSTTGIPWAGMRTRHSTGICLARLAGACPASPEGFDWCAAKAVRP